jgi:succinyl-diaminopimelate desuccinylase
LILDIKKQGIDFLPDGHGGAHGPDEALHIPSLLEAIKIYVLSIVRLDKLI